MIKSAGIDFVNIEPEKPDTPLGLSSGAGAIFGVTGGVNIFQLVDDTMSAPHDIAMDEVLCLG